MWLPLMLIHSQALQSYFNKTYMSELVSIIIPSYNSAQWVCDAIDSCLHQNHRFCEIIVVDDGSTDNTRDLLQHKYGDRIKYIYQENMGLAGARNTGLRHATGEFIQFLDADDLIHPNKIRLQVEQMKDLASPSVSYTDYYRCDINDNNSLILGRMAPVIDLGNPLLEIASHWETRISIPVHCFLFDSALFKVHCVLFDESLPNHEDWDCWMQVFALNPSVGFIDHKMAAYRIRTDSMCGDRRKMRDGFLAAISKQKQIMHRDNQIIKILTEKKKEVRYIYRDAGFWGRLLRHLPLKFRKISARIIPWRIQRLFD